MWSEDTNLIDFVDGSAYNIIEDHVEYVYSYLDKELTMLLQKLQNSVDQVDRFSTEAAESIKTFMESSQFDANFIRYMSFHV